MGYCDLGVGLEACAFSQVKEIPDAQASAPDIDRRMQGRREKCPASACTFFCRYGGILSYGQMLV